MKYKFIIVALVLSLAACKSEKEVKVEEQAAEMKTEEIGIQISNQWVRLAAKGMNTAAFFIIKNNSDINDTLVSASSDAAELVEVHETFMKDNDMMGMRQVEFVEIPANSTVQFKPRDLHVMFIKLNRDLKTGDVVNLTLNFKRFGELKFSAEVREMDMQKMMEH